MTLFMAFLNRRLAQLRHRWIGELSLALLLPIGIYITLGFGLSGGIPKLQGVPQLGWLIPGIVLMVAFAGALIALYNDLFHNRGINGFLFDVFFTGGSISPPPSVTPPNHEKDSGHEGHEKSTQLRRSVFCKHGHWKIVPPSHDRTLIQQERKMAASLM